MTDIYTPLSIIEPLLSQRLRTFPKIYDTRSDSFIV